MVTLSTQATSNLPAPRSARASVAITILTILLLSLPLLLTAAVAPKFEEIFKDFGVALPTLALWEIRLGRALSSAAGWVCVIGIIACFVVPASIWAGNRKSRAAALLSLAALLALVFVGLLVVSFYLPLSSMIESLQQNPKP